MPRLTTDVRLPQPSDKDIWARDLTRQLYRILTPMIDQLNALSEGKASAKYQSATTAPTTGSWAQSDIVYNSAVTELGSAGSMYTVLGWVCVAEGTPGTWVEIRAPDGA